MSRSAGGSNARLQGIAVVLAALMAVLVIAAIRGRVVAGTPVAEPLPDPPRPGDCVTQNLHDMGTPDEIYFWVPGGPSVRIESCDGVRFGEVAHVLTVPPLGETDQDSRDLAYSTCAEPVGEYLGLPPGHAESVMQPFVDPLMAVLGPTDRQRAAGQTWAACVVYPDPTPDGAPTIDHSVRNAWQRPADRWLVAACTDDLSVGKGISCGLPHRYEALSWAHGSPTATQESLDGWCRDANTQAVGSPTPFSHGDLVSLAVGVRQGRTAPLTESQVVEAAGDFDVYCVVTPADGTRLLTAPIRGLGETPPPLS